MKKVAIYPSVMCCKPWELREYIAEFEKNGMEFGGQKIYYSSTDDEGNRIFTHPFMYEGTLFVPGNILYFLSDSTTISINSQYYDIFINVDTENSGAYGITTDDLKH